MNFLNKKNALRDLSDALFEEKVGNIAKELFQNGFIYDDSSSEEIIKDWKSLCRKEVLAEEYNVPATCTTGMKIIRKNMPHFYQVKNYKGVDLVSLWTCENLEKALRFNRKYHSTPYVSEIIRSISFTNGLGKITIYRPVLAKTIVNYFNVRSILDVCVGWGGRMLGAKSVDSTVYYTGFEPCLKTYQGLCNIRDELNLENIRLFNTPAEVGLLNMIPTDEKFDLALTSPPYYNLEIYSNEKTQSVKANETYEQWLSSFIKPVIEQLVKRVKYSCWSIKNFKTDKKYNLYDDIVKIHEDLGWRKLDIVFSMKNSKRPGAKGSSIKTSEENTYVFVAK
jgi:16S rRNA G966 N2-methylase RsmD